MANVQVAVRVRPLNQRELDNGAKIIVEIQNDTIYVTNPKIPENSEVDSRERVKRFVFDYLFSPSPSPDCECRNASQEELFQELGVEILRAIFDGYNACVLAYGQSGSGKTYTMMGEEGEIGLIPRLCKALFIRLDDIADEKITFHIDVSFLEIYNERVMDLLQTHRNQKKRRFLKIREHPKLGTYVQDLSRHQVNDFQDVLTLIEKGNFNRSNAATDNHQRSSRSHAIFTINFTQAKLDADLPSETVSKIHLVDLAGSERAGSTYNKIRLKESSNINKSLVTLGNVISALADKSLSTWSLDSMGSSYSINSSASESVATSPICSPRRMRHSFVPYRDSVLTWLLKDCLGGNSKTLMVTTVSPASTCYTETISTLRYAQRTKCIVNRPVVNEDPNVKLIRQLRAEIYRLRKLLTAARMNNTLPSTADENCITEILNQNENKAKALTKSWFAKWQYSLNIIEDSGDCLSEQNSELTIDSCLPHLIVLDNHILSTGIHIYPLKKGKTVINKAQFVSEDEQQVHHMTEYCHISFDGVNVTLVPLNKQLCQINGKNIIDAVQLRQADIIKLGNNYTLRFNHPQEIQKLKAEWPSEKNLYGSNLTTSGLFSGEEESFPYLEPDVLPSENEVSIHCDMNNINDNVIENNHTTDESIYNTEVDITSQPTSFTLGADTDSKLKNCRSSEKILNTRNLTHHAEQLIFSYVNDNSPPLAQNIVNGCEHAAKETTGTELDGCGESVTLCPFGETFDKSYDSGLTNDEFHLCCAKCQSLNPHRHGNSKSVNGQKEINLPDAIISSDTVPSSSASTSLSSSHEMKVMVNKLDTQLPSTLYENESSHVHKDKPETYHSTPVLKPNCQSLCSFTKENEEWSNSFPLENQFNQHRNCVSEDNDMLESALGNLSKYNINDAVLFDLPAMIDSSDSGIAGCHHCDSVFANGNSQGSEEEKLLWQSLFSTPSDGTTPGKTLSSLTYPDLGQETESGASVLSEDFSESSSCNSFGQNCHHLGTSSVSVLNSRPNTAPAAFRRPASQEQKAVEVQPLKKMPSESYIPGSTCCRNKAVAPSCPQEKHCCVNNKTNLNVHKKSIKGHASHHLKLNHKLFKQSVLEAVKALHSVIYGKFKTKHHNQKRKKNRVLCAKSKLKFRMKKSQKQWNFYSKLRAALLRAYLKNALSHRKELTIDVKTHRALISRQKFLKKKFKSLLVEKKYSHPKDSNDLTLSESCQKHVESSRDIAKDSTFNTDLLTDVKNFVNFAKDITDSQHIIRVLENTTSLKGNETEFAFNTESDTGISSPSKSSNIQNPDCFPSDTSSLNLSITTHDSNVSGEVSLSIPLNNKVSDPSEDSETLMFEDEKSADDKYDEEQNCGLSETSSCTMPEDLVVEASVNLSNPNCGLSETSSSTVLEDLVVETSVNLSNPSCGLSETSSCTVPEDLVVEASVNLSNPNCGLSETSSCTMPEDLVVETPVNFSNPNPTNSELSKQPTFLINDADLVLLEPTVLDEIASSTERQQGPGPVLCLSLDSEDTGLFSHQQPLEKTSLVVDLLSVDTPVDMSELKRSLSNTDIQRALQVESTATDTEEMLDTTFCPALSHPPKIRTNSWPEPSQLSLEQLDSEIKDLQESLKEDLVNEVFVNLDEREFDGLVPQLMQSLVLESQEHGEGRDLYELFSDSLEESEERQPLREQEVGQGTWEGRAGFPRNPSKKLVRQGARICLSLDTEQSRVVDEENIYSDDSLGGTPQKGVEKRTASSSRIREVGDLPATSETLSQHSSLVVTDESTNSVVQEKLIGPLPEVHIIVSEADDEDGKDVVGEGAPLVADNVSVTYTDDFESDTDDDDDEDEVANGDVHNESNDEEGGEEEEDNIEEEMSSNSSSSSGSEEIYYIPADPANPNWSLYYQTTEMSNGRVMQCRSFNMMMNGTYEEGNSGVVLRKLVDRKEPFDDAINASGDLLSDKKQQQSHLPPIATSASLPPYLQQMATTDALSDDGFFDVDELKDLLSSSPCGNNAASSSSSSCPGSSGSSFPFPVSTSDDSSVSSPCFDAWDQSGDDDLFAAETALFAPLPPLDMLIDYRMMSPQDRRRLYTIPEMSSEYSSTPSESFGMQESASEAESCHSQVIALMEDRSVQPLEEQLQQNEKGGTPSPEAEKLITFGDHESDHGNGKEEETEENSLETELCSIEPVLGDSNLVTCVPTTLVAVDKPTTDAVAVVSEDKNENDCAVSEEMIQIETLDEPSHETAAQGDGEGEGTNTSECRELWKLYKRYSEESDEEIEEQIEVEHDDQDLLEDSQKSKDDNGSQLSSEEKRPEGEATSEGSDNKLFSPCNKTNGESQESDCGGVVLIDLESEDNFKVENAMPPSAPPTTSTSKFHLEASLLDLDFGLDPSSASFHGQDLLDGDGLKSCGNSSSKRDKKSGKDERWLSSDDETEKNKSSDSGESLGFEPVLQEEDYLWDAAKQEEGRSLSGKKVSTDGSAEKLVLGLESEKEKAGDGDLNVLLVDMMSAVDSLRDVCVTNARVENASGAPTDEGGWRRRRLSRIDRIDCEEVESRWDTSPREEELPETEQEDRSDARHVPTVPTDADDEMGGRHSPRDLADSLRSTSTSRGEGIVLNVEEQSTAPSSLLGAQIGIPSDINENRSGGAGTNLWSELLLPHSSSTSSSSEEGESETEGEYQLFEGRRGDLVDNAHLNADFHWFENRPFLMIEDDTLDLKALQDNEDEQESSYKTWLFPPRLHCTIQQGPLVPNDNNDNNNNNNNNNNDVAATMRRLDTENDDDEEEERDWLADEADVIAALGTSFHTDIFGDDIGVAVHHQSGSEDCKDVKPSESLLAPSRTKRESSITPDSLENVVGQQQQQQPLTSWSQPSAPGQQSLFTVRSSKPVNPPVLTSSTGPRDWSAVGFEEFWAASSDSITFVFVGPGLPRSGKSSSDPSSAADAFLHYPHLDDPGDPMPRSASLDCISRRRRRCVGRLPYTLNTRASSMESMIPEDLMGVVEQGRLHGMESEPEKTTNRAKDVPGKSYSQSSVVETTGPSKPKKKSVSWGDLSGCGLTVEEGGMRSSPHAPAPPLALKPIIKRLETKTIRDEDGDETTNVVGEPDIYTDDDVEESLKRSPLYSRIQKKCGVMATGAPVLHQVVPQSFSLKMPDHIKSRMMKKSMSEADVEKATLKELALPEALPKETTVAEETPVEKVAAEETPPAAAVGPFPHAELVHLSSLMMEASTVFSHLSQLCARNSSMSQSTQTEAGEAARQAVPRTMMDSATQTDDTECNVQCVTVATNTEGSACSDCILSLWDEKNVYDLTTRSLAKDFHSPPPSEEKCTSSLFSSYSQLPDLKTTTMTSSNMNRSNGSSCTSVFSNGTTTLVVPSSRPAGKSSWLRRETCLRKELEILTEEKERVLRQLEELYNHSRAGTGSESSPDSPGSPDSPQYLLTYHSHLQDACQRVSRKLDKMAAHHPPHNRDETFSLLSGSHSSHSLASSSGGGGDYLLVPSLRVEHAANGWSTPGSSWANLSHSSGESSSSTRCLEPRLRPTDYRAHLLDIRRSVVAVSKSPSRSRESSSSSSSSSSQSSSTSSSPPNTQLSLSAASDTSPAATATDKRAAGSSNRRDSASDDLQALLRECRLARARAQKEIELAQAQLNNQRKAVKNLESVLKRQKT